MMLEANLVPVPVQIFDKPCSTLPNGLSELIPDELIAGLAAEACAVIRPCLLMAMTEIMLRGK